MGVGNVDLSGLDYEAASARLSEAYGAYGTGRVVVRTGGTDVVVPYAAFARRADIGAMVDEAMQVGRSGTPVERAIAEVRLASKGVSLEPRLALDPAALTNVVRDAVSKLERAPVDARVIKSLKRIYTMPAQDGRTFDGAGAAAAALGVVTRTDAPDEVVVDAAPTTIPPAHGDSEALAAKTAAQRMIHDVVVTSGKKKWKIKASVDPELARIEVAADGTAWPTIDETAIPASLKKVAKSVRVEPDLGQVPQDERAATSWASRRARTAVGSTPRPPRRLWPRSSPIARPAPPQRR